MMVSPMINSRFYYVFAFEINHMGSIMFNFLKFKVKYTQSSRNIYAQCDEKISEHNPEVINILIIEYRNHYY